MKKRLLKKKLRDISNEELLDLHHGDKMGRRMTYMVDQEVGLRFDMVVTTMRIEFPRSTLKLL